MSVQNLNRAIAPTQGLLSLSKLGLQGFLGLSILFSGPVLAENAPGPGTTGTGGTRTVIESPVNYGLVSFKSGNRRDPFLSPLSTDKQSKKAEDEEIARGNPPPGIAGTLIAEAILQGTSLRDNGRIAILKAYDSRVYFLREGDRLFDGYVKSIDNDSITLVRETKMRSGKILTQDVTKRLRTP